MSTTSYSPKRLSKYTSPKRVAKYSCRELFARWACVAFAPIIAVYRSFTYQPRRLLVATAQPVAVAAVGASSVVYGGPDLSDASDQSGRLPLLEFCMITATIAISFVSLFSIPKFSNVHLFSTGSSVATYTRSQTFATSHNVQTESDALATLDNVQTESDDSLALVDSDQTELLVPAFVNNAKMESLLQELIENAQTESFAPALTDDVQTEFVATAEEDVPLAESEAEALEVEENEIPAKYLPVYVSVPGEFITPGAAPGFTPIEKAHYFNLVEPMEVSETAALRLAQIIEHEVAQSWWADDELILVMGTIVLNRVASPEFPDGIESVLYAEGQYLPRSNYWWSTNVPNERSVEAATRLLAGERYAPPEVVFQANFPQGSGTWLAMKDRQNSPRVEYFCTSRRPELYAEEETPKVSAKVDYLPVQVEIQ